MALWPEQGCDRECGPGWTLHTPCMCRSRLPGRLPGAQVLQCPPSRTPLSVGRELRASQQRDGTQRECGLDPLPHLPRVHPARPPSSQNLRSNVTGAVLSCSHKTRPIPRLGPRTALHRGATSPRAPPSTRAWAQLGPPATPDERTVTFRDTQSLLQMPREISYLACSTSMIQGS